MRDGRCVRADGTLAGAALDMASAVRNCVALLGLPLATHCVWPPRRRPRFSVLADSSAGWRPAIAPTSSPIAEDVSVIATWVAGTEDSPR